MLKFNPPIHSAFYLIFFSLVFLTSCSGQKKPDSTVDTSSINDLLLFPNLQNGTLEYDPQIAAFVVEIFEDSKGNLWFGTMSKGVARYDGRSLVYFSIKDGLAGNTVRIASISA